MLGGGRRCGTPWAFRPLCGPRGQRSGELCRVQPHSLCQKVKTGGAEAGLWPLEEDGVRRDEVPRGRPCSKAPCSHAHRPDRPGVKALVNKSCVKIKKRQIDWGKREWRARQASGACGGRRPGPRDWGSLGRGGANTEVRVLRREQRRGNGAGCARASRTQCGSPVRPRGGRAGRRARCPRMRLREPGGRATGINSE